MTSPRITDQKLINYVVKFMREQGAPAVDARHRTCVNETADGKRCAIACCFKNPGPSNQDLIERLIALGASFGTVTALRQAHDTAAYHADFVVNFEARLAARGMKLPRRA